MHFLLIKLFVTVIHFCLQERVEDFTIFLKNQHYTCYKLCPCKLNIVRNVLKSKEFPCLTFELMKRVSQPEFADQYLWIKMIMSYLEINIFLHK